jgi:uncharacterized protein
MRVRAASALAAVVLASLTFARSLPAQSDAPYVPDVAPGLARLVPPVPTPAGFVADVPGVIPPAAEAAINARIRALQDSGFGDVAVAVVSSVGDYEPSELGVAIYRTWRVGRIDEIGSARRNLGVLLLLVPKEVAPDGEGHCWITTGTGAEGIVTDGASAAICRERIVPHMRERDHAAAVLAGVDAISERLHGDEALTEIAGDGAAGGRRSGGFRWWHALLGAAGTAVSAIGAFRWRRFRPRRCPRCSKRMRRLGEADDDVALDRGQRLEEQLKSVDYDVWECECGERTLVPWRRWTSSYSECATCRRRTVKTARRTLRAATYSRSGMAEDTLTCKACGAVVTNAVTLPMLVHSSSSSSGGGGGGGGGSSFGGSGSTSGGGGGSSY